MVAHCLRLPSVVSPVITSQVLVKFYCVDTHSPPILGMKSCLDYQLIKLVYTCNADPKPKSSGSEPMNMASVLSEYSYIFKGVGLIPGEAEIHLDPKIAPVVHPQDVYLFHYVIN